MMLLRLALVATAVVPSVAIAQDSPPEARFAGTWVVEGASAARRGRDQAIDRATEDMSIFTKGIARRRLRDGTPIHRTVRITGADQAFRCQVGDYDLAFAANGRSHPITDPFDNQLEAKQRFRDGRLVQTMKSDDATLTHTLALSDDGQRLILTVRIESHHLPGDVVFRVRYRRGQ